MRKRKLKTGKRYNKAFSYYKRFYYRRYWNDVERKKFNDSLKNCDFSKFNVERIAQFSNWRIRTIGHYSEFIKRVNRKMRKSK